MTDVHKLSRIFTIFSKRTNTPTFVIQHGATVGEAGYLPIIADKMLVWGEGSLNWFVERRQPLNKLQIVGSPRMDSTLYEKLELDQLPVPKLNKALIIMSEEIIEEDFLLVIKDALAEAAISNLEIIIKLHPGKSVDYSFIPEGVFQKSGLNYRILRYESTKLLLQESDVVFVTTSSVGMEAIIQNKPVFQFKSRKRHNYRMSYEDFDCSHLFETSDQLHKIISNPATVISKLQNYFPFVNYYFGKLDGSSAKRIKKYIVNYQSNS
jgi:CDP-glycerol glycerophosphotransferase (TagB/SpsB family)